MQNAIARIAIVAAFAASATLASSAFAASTAELKVKGRIVPFACTPTIGAGAVVDYGTMTASSLTAGKANKLDTKEVPFSISCEGATKMAVTAVDNKAASKVTGLAAQISGTATEASMFGLGTSAGGKKIGAFHFAMKQNSFTGDGTAVDTIGSAVGATPSWSKSTAGGMSTDRMLSWAASGATTPGSYKTVSGTLAVTAVLDKPENIGTTEDITLDGSATIEVKYL